MLIGLHFVAYSVCFCVQHRTTSSKESLATVDQLCQHQLLIKKLPHRGWIFDGNNSSIESPSSHVTLACAQLTTTNQHEMCDVASQAITKSASISRRHCACSRVKLCHPSSEAFHCLPGKPQGRTWIPKKEALTLRRFSTPLLFQKDLELVFRLSA